MGQVFFRHVSITDHRQIQQAKVQAPQVFAKKPVNAQDSRWFILNDVNYFGLKLYGAFLVDAAQSTMLSQA